MIRENCKVVVCKPSISEQFWLVLACFPDDTDQMFALLCAPNSVAIFGALRTMRVSATLAKHVPELEYELEYLEETVVFWRECSAKQHNGITISPRVVNRLCHKFRAVGDTLRRMARAGAFFHV
eukprot:JP437128.1.p1 GENE.JP437128.1~~JP437128.1.p1  ORF type:complete len:145 (-),score=19.59 JP437128.1:202-573(-)